MIAKPTGCMGILCWEEKKSICERFERKRYPHYLTLCLMRSRIYLTPSPSVHLFALHNKRIWVVYLFLRPTSAYILWKYVCRGSFHATMLRTDLLPGIRSRLYISPFARIYSCLFNFKFNIMSCVALPSRRYSPPFIRRLNTCRLQVAVYPGTESYEKLFRHRTRYPRYRRPRRRL